VPARVAQRKRRPLAAILIIMRVRALLLLLCVAPLVGAQDQWPFGVARGMRKGDFYNLGLIGLKAMDAQEPVPSNTPPRGGRRRSSIKRGPHDNGPDALRVMQLFPDGTAAKAGLQKGDIIVGVGSRRFSDGSMEQIAKALLKAESKKGEVTLFVQKGDSGKAQKIKVMIPVGGKAASKPTVGEGRAALVKAALAFLASKQTQNGGYSETLSGLNGAIVQGSLSGLAWLGDGGELYDDNLKRLAAWMGDAVQRLGKSRSPGRGGANWNQTNWGLAYGAMFLGEYYERTKDPAAKTSLHFCAEVLVKNQEKSGGWAHGPGGPNALGYVELNIVTGLALCGLGVAQRSGYEVPKECLERAEQYLKDSSSGDGGVGYSTKPGQKGSGNIGRSACAWIGYLALKKAKSGWGKKLGAYVKRHVGEVLGGHASLMQHIQIAGIAACAHGGATQKEFWKSCQRDLVLARAPDGSFQPRPWHESLSMGSNSDVSTGDVWTTASWACTLVAEIPKKGRGGFPALFGR